MKIVKGEFSLIYYQNTVYRRFGPNQWEKQFGNFWEPVLFCDELEEMYNQENIMVFKEPIEPITETMTAHCLHIHTYVDTAGWHCVDCGESITPVWR